MEAIIGIEDAIKAVDLLWNNKFAEAEALLDKNRAKVPRLAIHYAESMVIQSFLTADNGDQTKAGTRLKDAKVLAESHLKFLDKGQLPPEIQLPAGLDANGKANAIADLWLNSRLVLGDSAQMNAVLKVMTGSKLKGVLLIRKSWKVFESTLEHVTAQQKLGRVYNPELLRCLRFGVGFFYFIISIIPTKYLRFAQFAGFKADRNLGLQYIREVQEQGRVRLPFATIILLFHCLIVPRGLSDVSELLSEADRVITATLAKYPNGTAWHIMASMSSRKRLDVAAGLEHCRIALETARALGREPTMLAYEFGCVHVMMLKWSQAASLLEQLLNRQGFRVRGTCALQIAACYMMSGQKDRAIEMWHRVPTLTGKSSTVDHYVLTWAQRYIQNGGHFCAFEMLYIRRDLAKMKAVMGEALSLLEAAAHASGILNQEGKLIPSTTSIHHEQQPQQQQQQQPQQTQTNDTKNVLTKGFKAFKSMASSTMQSIKGKKEDDLDFTNDNRASYLLLKGAMLKYSRSLNDPEAMACLEEIPKMQGVLVEKWYIPYAYYELCESNFYQGKTDIAASMLKKCITFKDYQWEDPLKMRIRVTADQLKRGPSLGEKMIMAPGVIPVATVDVDDDDGEVIQVPTSVSGSNSPAQTPTPPPSSTTPLSTSAPSLPPSTTST